MRRAETSSARQFPEKGNPGRCGPGAQSRGSARFYPEPSGQPGCRKERNGLARPMRRVGLSCSLLGGTSDGGENRRNSEIFTPPLTHPGLVRVDRQWQQFDPGGIGNVAKMQTARNGPAICQPKPGKNRNGRQGRGLWEAIGGGGDGLSGSAGFHRDLARRLAGLDYNGCQACSSRRTGGGGDDGGPGRGSQ
jgi:hypothetical protein